MEHERDSLDTLRDAALVACYALTAAVIITVYREPLRVFAGAVGEWYRRNNPHGVASIRALQGALWNDVRDALRNADDA